jgi:hypothetical protein
MGSALPVLVQSNNLSLEIWSSDGCRPNYNAAIDTAFVLMPIGTGETEESLLACTLTFSRFSGHRITSTES